MSIIRQVLEFVQDLLGQAQRVSPTTLEGESYNEGYIDALEEVEEWISDEMWEEGEE